MLTATEILARVRARPFSPLRIVTNSGQAYDILHPDLILVGRRELTIGRPWSHNPALYEGQDRVAVLHVTALEDIAQPLPPSTNGPAAGA
jgi:hypothetical protein